MTCARQRRLESEAHEIATLECGEGAADLGLTANAWNAALTAAARG